jgi:hypothetical protein
MLPELMKSVRCASERADPEGGAVYRDFLGVVTASRSRFHSVESSSSIPVTKDFLIALNESLLLGRGFPSVYLTKASGGIETRLGQRSLLYG